ncbi:MAG: hypothetical protein RIS43_259 [Actinomycetota bacterium]
MVVGEITMKFVTHKQVPTMPLSRIGVGAMPFSHEGAETHRAEKVWHDAFDMGINLINTADCYAPSGDTFGHNEKLVGAAVTSYGRDKVFVVTKNGLRRQGTDWWRDNTPEYLREAVQASNERLGFVPDAILLHRLNREQSLAAAVEALCEMRDRGFMKYVGVSNVSLSEFDVAWKASGGTIAFVENERSPRYRDHADVLDACNRHGVAYLAWSPLGGGNAAKELGFLHPEFAEVGLRHGVTAQQVALAWLLTQGDAMLPIPAFRRLETTHDSVNAVEIGLTKEDLELLNSASDAKNSVYPD